MRSIEFAGHNSSLLLTTILCFFSGGISLILFGTLSSSRTFLTFVW
jgi:hypothetical protein